MLVFLQNVELKKSAALFFITFEKIRKKEPAATPIPTTLNKYVYFFVCSGAHWALWAHRALWALRVIAHSFYSLPVTSNRHTARWRRYEERQLLRYVPACSTD